MKYQDIFKALLTTDNKNVATRIIKQKQQSRNKSHSRKVTAFMMLLTLLGATQIAVAENLSLVSYYGKTGGIVGDGTLNAVGNQVNGKVICSANNTNANNEPGCDMSDDPGYQKNDINDPTDDTYSGDLIVRTNDQFEVFAGWAVTGGNEPVTITAVLPSNTLRWASLPASCKAGSSISADELTLVCVRSNYTAASAYSEDIPFNIVVKGGTQNGVEPGDVSITIDSANATPKSDAVGASIKVTATPRWNIQKSLYTHAGGQTFGGVEGAIQEYKYYLEVDEVDGETDTTSALLGNESLGSDFTLEFDDDLSSVSPNAQLIECRKDRANTNDPYSYSHSTYPDRSVATPLATMVQTCTQAAPGANIHVKHEHIDTSLDHIPTLTYIGTPIPATRAVAAIGTIRVFIPNTDIFAGVNATDTSGANELKTKNVLTSFDPDSISGQSNFGADTESTKDNTYARTLYGTGGSFSKHYTTNPDLWWESEPGGATGYRAGDGVITPGANWTSRVNYYNSGSTTLTGGIVCDIFDSNTVDVIDMPTTSGQAIKVHYNNGQSDASTGAVYEYGTGYVSGSWPPNPNADPSAKVVQECGNTATWHATTTAAKAVGPITKIRVRFVNGLVAGTKTYTIINLKARSNDLAGGAIPSGTIIPNYASVTDNDYFNSTRYPATNGWYPTSYQPKSSYDEPHGGGGGDRILLVRGKVRVIKTLSQTNVTTGDVLDVVLKPTFTCDSSTIETSTVKLTEMLDGGLTYKAGSSSNPPGEPVIGSCTDVEAGSLKDSCTASNQILIWDLGTRDCNSVIPELNYQTEVDAGAPIGTLHTYTMVSSPTDTSPLTIRTANKNVTVSIPSALILTKSTPDSYYDIDDQLKYAVNVRNGTSNALTNMEVIDILPFNGDGADGYKLTIGPSTSTEKRSPASNFDGTLSFNNASMSTSCAGTPTFHYTNTTPKNIDISPTAASNNGGSTTWCAGTATGPAAGCGFNKSAVTAVRTKGVNLPASALCTISMVVDTSGQSTTRKQQFANTAGAYAVGVSLPTISNLVVIAGEQPVAVNDEKSNPNPSLPSNPTSLDITTNDSHPDNLVSLDKTTVNFDPASVTGGVGTDTDADGDIDQVVVAGEGTWTADDNGIVTFTPLAGFTGNPSPLSYIIKSTNGFESEPATITVDYPQTGPVAVDDSKSGLIPGNPGSINVVTNDSDPENDLDPATVVITSSVVSGAVIAGDGKSMTVPNEGSWTVSADGTMTFTPLPSFKGDPSPIGYKVSDQNGNTSNEAIVTLDYDPLRVISGHVGIDLTGDNTPEKDPLEPVAITLYAADGVTVVATTLTDSFGNYSFDVPGGNYIVKEDADPTGTTSVWDKDGTDDNTIAVDATTTDVTDNDFVERPILGNIKGTTFKDNNQDDNQGGSEVIIPNIDITVTDAYGVEHTVSTDASGNYDLTEIPVGPAAVTVKSDDPDIPEGATSTVTGGLPVSVEIPAGAYVVKDFGYYIPALNDIDPAGLAGCANPSSITWEGSTVSSASVWNDMNSPYSKSFTTVGGNAVGVTMTLEDTSGQFNHVDGSGTFVGGNGIFTGPYLTMYLGKQANPATTDGYLLNAGESATLTVIFDEEVLLDNWRIRDVDSGDIRSSVAGWDWQDAVKMTGYDVNGNPVELEGKLGGASNLQKDANGFIHTYQTADFTGGGTDSIAPKGHIVYSSNGVAIKSIKLIHKAGPDRANQTRSAIALSGFAICTPLHISGSVFNDADGDTNGVNGPTLETADGAPLYAHLVDATGNVVDNVVIASDGTYLFDKNININTNYTVVLSKDQTPADSSMPAPVLPENWFNVSEGIDGALDGSKDGVIATPIVSTSLENVDFGIDKKPEAGDVTAASQSNPGSDVKVQVVDLVVTDDEDTTPTTVVIESLPTQGTLYYNGVAVTPGQEITGFDKTLLTVDPKKGNVNVVFDYHTVDAAGVPSESATVTMPFTFLPPKATDDALSNPVSGSDSVIDILSNDNLPADKGTYDLDPTTVKLIDPNSGDEVTTLTVDGEGVWTVDPVNGKVTFNPDADFTDDPTPVDYSVEDTEGNKVTAEITIDYPQGEPTIVDDKKSGDRGQPVIQDILANDTDPENDIDPTTVKLIDPSDNSEVTALTVLNEGKWEVDPVTGAVTFTPNADFFGDPTPVLYTAKDSTGRSPNQPAKIEVDYPQTKPQAEDDEYLDQPVGASVTISVVGNDSDPENDLDPTTVRLVDGSGNPVLTLNVSGEGVWNVDPQTGDVTFTPEIGFLGDPTPVKYTVKDITGLESNQATITIDYKQEFAAIKGTVWFDAIKDNTHNPGETLLPEWTVIVKDLLGNEIARTTTNNQGGYSFDHLQTGIDYKLEILSANGVLMKVENVDALLPNEVKTYELPVDPSGVFYDSHTRELIEGVVLEIVNASGTPVDPSCLLSPTQQNQTTGSDGFYRFDRAPGSPHATCPAGSVLVMRVKSTPPEYVTGFSTLYPPEAGNFDGDSNPANCTYDAIPGGSFCEIQSQSGAPQAGVDSSTRYYTGFILNSGDRDIINNHIPLDPILSGKSSLDIVLTKSVNKKQASVGDQLYYSITADNTKEGNPATSIDIMDNLPQGFKFTGSTAKLVVDTDLNGKFDPAEYAAATTVKAVGEGANPVRFGAIPIAANQKIQIGYLLKVGTGVRQGEAVNTAQAVQPTTTTPVSNIATATVLINAESVLDDSTLIGKVFHDRDYDGYQDDADATGITIRSGKWSKSLGNLKGRVSVLDNPTKHSKTIRVPHTGASQIKVTTKQGTVVSFGLNGQITESHTGMKAKGLTAQEIVITARKVGNATDVTVTNYGIHEEGIPGVRLATVKGLLIETDGYGRYHIPDADGGRRDMGKNFILKVDKATLPEGAKFTTENPRVLRLTGSALNKINFGVKLPGQAAPQAHIQRGSVYRSETQTVINKRQVPVFKSVDVNLGSIFFDKDKHNIRADQRGIMDDIASKIQRYGRGHITIDAFTDSRHNAQYNIELAKRRANTVRAELHKRLGSKLMRNVKVDVDKRAYNEVPHNDPRAIDYKKAQ